MNPRNEVNSQADYCLKKAINWAEATCSSAKKARVLLVLIHMNYIYWRFAGIALEIQTTYR